MRLHSIIFPILIGLLATATPSTGDWLVTQDGQKVETQGPWRIDGKKVVFKTIHGSLAMMRLSEIDLEASRRASAPPAAAPEGTTASDPEPSKAPVVLTDEDLAFRPKGLARRLAYRKFEKRMDTMRRPGSKTDPEKAAELINGLEEALTLMLNTADRFPALDSVPETEEEMDAQIEPLYAYAKALEEQIDFRSHQWQVNLLESVAFSARLIADDASKRLSSGLDRVDRMLR